MNKYLTIAQLEEYNFWRFVKWALKNKGKLNLESKRAINWTIKLRVIWTISYAFLFLILVLILYFFKNLLFTFLALVGLLIFPAILISFALLIIYPIDFIIKFSAVGKTYFKIKALKKKGLRVIAITGSYGKSTTKEFLFQLIKSDFKVLRTPESFNTILGIAKVVDWELDQSYDIFICEVGAYKRGDIALLSNMIQPDFGLITGITEQHLERFGDLLNIKKAKFELYDYISDKSKIILNTEDQNIKDVITNQNLKLFQEYITQTEFDKKYKNKLLSAGNLQNLRGAVSMAKVLGLRYEELQKNISSIQPIEHRMSTYKLNKATIFDNTYSSNIQSFNQIIDLAKKLKGKKVLITPGLVELGGNEVEIHNKLGKLLFKNFDKYILVGTNNRTQALAKNLPENTEFIEDKKELYFKTIDNLSRSYEWIFLENDITQNY